MNEGFNFSGICGWQNDFLTANIECVTVTKMSKM